MSPSSSALPTSNRNIKLTLDDNSSSATPISGQESQLSRRPSKQERLSSRPNSPQVPPLSPRKRILRYTVFVRLPFPRESFEDPPSVEWDATKDRKLWKLISGSHAATEDVDWEGLSHDFGVDLSFLLMQAAWLSEQHMDRMRKQVVRIAGGQAESGGNAVASAVGGLKMERTGSRESKMHPSSITTTRRASPSYPVSTEPGDSPSAATPLSRATISRTQSSATVTQSKITNLTSSKQPVQVQYAIRGSSGSGRRPSAAISGQGSPREEYYDDAIEHEHPSDSASEEEPSTLTKSQAFRRPPVSRKMKQTLGTLSSDGDAEEEDDDDSSGGYLPFAAASRPGQNDPSATLRDSPRKHNSRPATTVAPSRPKTARDNSAMTTTTESSASSASSAMHQFPSSDPASGTEHPPQTHGRSDHPPRPLSPRHRAQLASLSPRFRKEGSEGSPSMGSSFSDLDDTSVTQSALEDALLSNMRQGGNGYGSSMASRVSSIRDVLGRKPQQ